MDKNKEVMKKIEKYFNENDGNDPLDYEQYCIFWKEVLEISKNKK